MLVSVPVNCMRLLLSLIGNLEAYIYVMRKKDRDPVREAADEMLAKERREKRKQMSSEESK